MATTFVDVLLQVRDELGSDVLAGGFIQTDEAGTTTPLATYTDLAGGSANTNPVELDTAGMAVIRQTNGVAYKWRIYDADMNLLWTRDNITVGLSASEAGSEYLIHLSFQGTPTAQGFMGGHIFDDSVTVPIDLEGAQGYVGTNPASTFDIKIELNGAQVATASIDTAGAYTFSTVGGTTVVASAGDKLIFRGPDSVGVAADFLITVPGALA